MEDQNKRVSDQLVRLIQIVFGFVLAQSIGRYEEIFLHPFNRNHHLASLAIFTIFLTTMFSWIDWHITMGLRPYNFDPRDRRGRLIDELRLFSDMFIVIVYAYVLLTIKEFSSDPRSDISGYLFGFVLIYLGYFFSGFLRRLSYGRLASQIGIIIIFGIYYLLLYLSYHLRFFGFLTQENIKNSNIWFILLALLTMIEYRLRRRNKRNRSQKRKNEGLKIGIDVDGVLANQISGILPRIKRRKGISLSYEDIKEWNLPIGQSSIEQEILLAMEDREYVLSMPPHSDALYAVNKLYQNNYIDIITARPAVAEEWTRLWLSRHGFSFDSIKSSKEMKKSQFATDILVDDYINNIKEYLNGTNGFAIIVDQPWNKSREDLSEFINCGRLFIIYSLRNLPELAEKIRTVVLKRNGA
jgi:5'(3')-deoxyribonucleotidase